MTAAEAEGDKGSAGFGGATTSGDAEHTGNESLQGGESLLGGSCPMPATMAGALACRKCGTILDITAVRPASPFVGLICRPRKFGVAAGAPPRLKREYFFMRLKGLVTMITGGGSGFGAGICETYAAHGAKVVVADINGHAAERVAAALKARGSDAIGCQGDVSKSADMKSLVDTATRQYGRLDVMVNNAGMSHANQPMLNVPEEIFDRIFQVNVKSIYLSAMHCVPIFRQQGSGCFINVASTAGVRPRPGLTWYNGSKGAVILFTKSMAVELAPEKIRVNAINPVIGETGLLSTFMGAEDTPANRAKFIATIPLGRLSRPSDIANAAVFLADPASEFITGLCMEVDGGRCV
ncbi:MAG: 4-formylbenzenesulfonate dehydrogenase TsaC1/TsaC2 [Verrucomicrobiota bacterium]